jgi:hypothetical protein
VIRDHDIERFVERLRARLAVGARFYGNTSFDWPEADLIDEVQGELEDVAGWGLLLWVRMQRLRERIEREQSQGGIDGN